MVGLFLIRAGISTIAPNMRMAVKNMTLLGLPISRD